MYLHIKQLLVEKAEKKVSFLEKSLSKYMLASIVAGIFIGFVYFFSGSVGGVMKTSTDGTLYKLFVGISFTMALKIIVFGGAELFTGNNMLMVTGVLARAVTIKNMLALWFFCYVGNFIGSVIYALVLLLSGAGDETTRALLIGIAEGKAHYSAIELFVRGIMCNFMICIGALMAYTLKEEIAKIVMMFWCVIAFFAAGYEHSIANMSLFSIAWIWDQGEVLKLSAFANNLLWVTLGNIVGGGIVGWIYFALGNEK